MKDAQAIATIRNIGESFIALADYLVEYVKAETEQPAEVKASADEQPKLEDVRAILAEISRSGKTSEMKELLSKFGAARLSDVDPKDYAELLAAAREVKNA